MKTNKIVAIEHKIKSSLGGRAFDIFNALLMCTTMLPILIPPLHVLSAFLSDPLAYMRHEGLLQHPLDFCLDAYKVVARSENILTGHMNIIFIVVVGTAVNLISTLVTVYRLSHKNAMWNDVSMLVVVFSMCLSGGIVPSYLVVKEVSSDGSTWFLIILTVVSTHSLIIIRTAMVSVLENLKESARLNSASHQTILWKIMVPLMKPTIAAICLYCAVRYWNPWFNAMLFVRDKASYPLRLVLREVLLQNDTSAMIVGVDDYLINETIQFATIAVTIVPILATYPFAQRYFVKGVMIGAVKG